MIDGYETENQRKAREEREAAAARAREASDAHQRTEMVRRELLPRIIAERSDQPPDCMVEIRGTTLFRERSVVRRSIPAWYLGSFVSGYDSYGGASSYAHFALGTDNRLHVNGNGVGSRREFTVLPYMKTDLKRWLGDPRLLGLLETLLAEQEPAAAPRPLPSSS